MRLKDNRFTLWMSIYSIIGWPVLFLFGDKLPNILAKTLAVTLFVSFVLIIIIGNYLLWKGRKEFEANDVNTKKFKQRIRIFTTLVALIIAGLAFINFYLPQL